MAITLAPTHRWEVGQTFGRLPEDPNASFTVPDKTWVAVVVDNTTGRPVVKSDLKDNEQAARREAEARYAAWKRQNGVR
ncbi:MAG: hypothetical protein LBV60_23865 [Streptomyces sp.]|jgi:hypothetical protein|nr:hypothetical protein [Streptomyces sp.]